MKLIPSFILLTFSFFYSLTAYAQWQTNGSSIFYKSGKVGIGTEEPTSTLQVQGDIYIPYENGFQGSAYVVGSQGDTGKRIRLFHNGTYGYMDFQPTLHFRSGSGDMKNIMTLHESGNVGIGVTAPGSKLHVAGNIHIPFGNSMQGSAYSIGNTGANGKRVRLFHNDTYAYMDFYPTMYFRSGSGEMSNVMILHESGNVGIGVTTPGFKLDVAGSIRIPAESVLTTSAATFEYGGKTMNVQGLRWGADNNESLPGLWMSGQGGIKLFTSKQPRLTIHSNGNVGIGTETPAHTLEVNGTIRAKEIKIETGWADFVFTPEYKLPSLMEVEEHISKHQHLPGIPTESEVKENGVNLGEMQVKLLQKIEELTLYTIEQQKYITTQQEQINILKEEVEKLNHKLNNQ